MGEILLRAENIDKHFGITHALDNVSFTFEKGEIPVNLSWKARRSQLQTR